MVLKECHFVIVFALYSIPIVGNFSMVQTLPVLVDGLYTTKVKLANLNVRRCSLCSATTYAKLKTTKISSGASAGISAKICTHENFPLYGTSLVLC